jgi:hypothetical protein
MNRKRFALFVLTLWCAPLFGQGILGGNAKLGGNAIIGAATSAAPALLVHTSASAAAATITTSAINPTGAAVLVCVVGGEPGSGTLGCSDSSSNSWTACTAVSDSNGSHINLFYVLSPTTTSSQTFTGTTASGTLTGIMVSAYSVANALDHTCVSAATTTGTGQPGSITPSQTNDVFVTAGTCHGGTGSAYSVNSGFTILDTPSEFADAYQVYNSVSALNPTWTFTGSSFCASIQIAFK